MGDNKTNTASVRAVLGRVSGVAFLGGALVACATGPTDDRFDGPNYSAHYQGEPVTPYEEPERYLPRPPAAYGADALPAARLPGRRRSDDPAPSVATPAEAPPAVVGEPDDPAPAPKAPAASVPGQIRVHLLNVGAGSCQIVECPDSDDMLIVDCGSVDPGPDDMSREDIAGYLDAIGAQGRIMVALSHPHENHYNAIAPLLGARNAESVWLGGDFIGYGGEGADRIDRWLDGQAAAGVDIYHGFPSGFANRGRPVEGLQCGSANTYILTVNIGGNPNANSMMLLVEHGDFRVIFAGDAEGATEDSAVENFGAMIRNVSVLTASNHGESENGSNQRSWAMKTAPQTVVFSTGQVNGHPRRSAGEKYTGFVFDDVRAHAMWWDPVEGGKTNTFETTKALYATAVSGRVLIESDGSNFSLRCEKAGTTTECF